jgi:hypothetical protein
MASSKKPKGIEEDLARKILALLRKGTPAAKKKATELQGIQRAYRNDASKMRSGQEALGKEWNRKLGAEYYATKRASEAKSVSQRLREESRLKGMDSKFKKVAKRERADEGKAATNAGIRAERRKATKDAGGRNAPDRIDARKRAAENRSKNARPKTAAGGAGKGPKNPKKTGTASAPKGPKKPRNPKK